MYLPVDISIDLRGTTNQQNLLHAVLEPPRARRNIVAASGRMPGASSRAWHALIRTHHITSRKKVAKLRQAASAEDVYALIRYGGAPGIMYVQGRKGNVDSWVAAVQVCQSVSTYSLSFFLCNLVIDSPYRN